MNKQTQTEKIEIHRSIARNAWMATFPDEPDVIETAFTLNASFDYVKSELEILNPDCVVVMAYLHGQA